MAATLNAATFMRKNFSTIQSVVKKYEDLTLKQMFDVTAQLVNNQDEINGLDKIQWEKNSWKRLSLIGDETVINLQSKSSRRIYVVRVEIDEKTAYIQARSPMARALEINGKARQAEGEEKVV